MWVYAAYSKISAKYVVYVKLIRSERQIFIEIPAEHFSSTEKLELQFGHDFYLPGLHGSLFDVNFQWGNDGEFKGTIDEIEEYYNRDYSIPQRFVYAFDTVQ